LAIQGHHVRYIFKITRTRSILLNNNDFNRETAKKLTLYYQRLYKFSLKNFILDLDNLTSFNSIDSYKELYYFSLDIFHFSFNNKKKKDSLHFYPSQENTIGISSPPPIYLLVYYLFENNKRSQKQIENTILN
jgi:hypothetical protein